MCLLRLLDDIIEIRISSVYEDEWVWHETKKAVALLPRQVHVRLAAAVCEPRRAQPLNANAWKSWHAPLHSLPVELAAGLWTALQSEAPKHCHCWIKALAAVADDVMLLLRCNWSARDAMACHCDDVAIAKQRWVPPLLLWWDVTEPQRRWAVAVAPPRRAVHSIL